MTSTPCVFCEIAAGRASASIVAQNSDTIAFMDLRQFHPGHVLVIPRMHVNDIRDASDEVATSVMLMVAHVSRAVNAAFPNDGISIWHSAGEGANQEVPHLHFHVHPRYFGDKVLDVYPSAPTLPERSVLEQLGARVRAELDRRD